MLLQGSIDGEQRGLVPRAVQALGEGIEADSSGAEFEVGSLFGITTSLKFELQLRSTPSSMRASMTCIWLRESQAGSTCPA